MSKPRILHITAGSGKAGIERKIIVRSEVLERDFEFGHLGLFNKGLLDDYFRSRGWFSETAYLKRLPLYFYPYYFTKISTIATIAKKFRPDIIHVYLAPYQWIMVKAAKKIGAKLIHEATNANIYRRKILAAYVESQGLKRVDKAIAISEHVVDHYREYFRADVSKFEVVYNGIDTDLFRPPSLEEKSKARRRFGIEDDSLLIGGIGRFVPHKGMLDLAKAFVKVAKGFPDIKLLLVGDGREETAISDVLSDIRDRVFMPGFIRDPESFYRAIDIFVCPSKNEAFGSVLAEAMATGLCCISTNAGGLSEIGVDGESCIYIDPGDIGAIIDGIRDVVNNTEIQKTLSINARKRIEDHFTVGQMTSKIQKLYAGLLR